MKKVRIIAVAVAALLVSLSASAQRNYGPHSHYSDRYVINSVHVSYSPLTAKVITKGSKSVTHLTGLSIGWAQLAPVSSMMPLYVEYGVGAQYSFLMKKHENRNMFSLNAPISVAYQVGLPGSSIALLPYAGIDLGYNLFGSKKVGDERVGYFSDLEFNRFMLGGHLGVRLMLGQIFFGIAYQGDFNELTDNLKYTQAQFSFGILF